jgi:cellulose biosynthesis protein BcsQ
MLVAFDTPERRNSTSSMIAVLGGVGFLGDKGASCLVVSIGTESYPVEEALGLTSEDIERNGGVKELERLILTGKLIGDLVRDNSISIIKDRVDLISLSQLDKDNALSLFRTILYASKTAYDFVMVDATVEDTQVRKTILDSSDIVVICITQDEYALSKDMDSLREKYKDKKVVYCVIDFESSSYLSLSRISSKYNINRKDLLCVPRSVKFMDSVNKRDPLSFIARTSVAKRAFMQINDEYVFASNLKRLTNRILEKAEVLVERGGKK